MKLFKNIFPSLIFVFMFIVINIGYKEYSKSIDSSKFKGLSISRVQFLIDITKDSNVSDIIIQTKIVNDLNILSHNAKIKSMVDINRYCIGLLDIKHVLYSIDKNSKKLIKQLCNNKESVK